MRIAICTSDGTKVDLHFGKTGTFYIYNVEKGKMKLIDRRHVEQYSPVADNEIGAGHRHPFQKDKFEQIYRTVSDCRQVYTVSVGDMPKQRLKKKGIEVVQCTCLTDRILISE